MRASLLLLLVCGTASAGELQIRRGPDAVTVTTGAYTWQLSTSAFDVVHSASAGAKRLLGPGRVTVEALGGPVVFGPPSEVTTGADWVELRGWASREKNLYYVARYQFFADRPFARLVLTLTDRHDTSPAAEPWEPHWKDRVWSRWRLEIGATGGKPTVITQRNSYSWSGPGTPWLDIVSASGSPYQWALDPSRGQLVHGAKDGANQVIWHPMVDGTAALAAIVTPFSGGSGYRAAKAVTYEIVDASGKIHTRAGDQRSGTIDLGSYSLNQSSIVRLRATGGGEEVAIAGPLRVTPAGGKPFDIKGARHDGILSDGPVTLAVKDFWQHHPMSLVRTQNAIGWQAIETPEQYTGGMGLTIECLIAIDGPPAAAAAALYAPPRRELPKNWFGADGTLARTAAGTRYDGLLKLFAARFWTDLETMDSFGWRNWGDYQIGTSYSTGGLTEDWANLQYDLPLGLLLTWLRTGDPAVWRFAQASVRHLMDLDLVKFHPFMDKLDGLVYRKGEMPRSRSHVSAEPITDQGFAFRSLLLYHHLTGENWARELARQNIDRLVYYAETRPQFVLHGGRPTAWMLRAALAGAENFPGEHDYAGVADRIVGQLVTYYKANGRLPGTQPVWQAQMIEGLAQYHRKTGRADVADVIVGSVRKLLAESVRRTAQGGYEFMYCYTESKDCSPQWTNEDNYLFLWLSSIAYAHRISRDPFFSKWADALFSYGEAKMRERNDIRSWTSVLAFPQLYLE